MKQCKTNTKKGLRCEKNAISGSEHCRKHQKSSSSKEQLPVSNEGQIALANTWIAAMTALIGLLALIVSIFGYQINKSLEIRNQIESEIKQAKDRRELWSNLEKVEQAILEQVDNVSADISQYMKSYVEIFNEIERLQYTKQEISLYSLDMNLNAAYASLIGNYAKLESSLEKVTTNYHNSVLLNSPLVKALNINCWELYMNERNSFESWKKEVLKEYRNSFIYVKKIIDTGTVPKSIEADIIKMGHGMGASLTKLSPPSLKGLWNMKMSNYPMPDGSLKSNIVQCES